MLYKTKYASKTLLVKKKNLGYCNQRKIVFNDLIKCYIENGFGKVNAHKMSSVIFVLWLYFFLVCFTNDKFFQYFWKNKYISYNCWISIVECITYDRKDTSVTRQLIMFFIISNILNVQLNIWKCFSYFSFNIWEEANYTLMHWKRIKQKLF